MKSVTAFKDSLNSKTSNANAVCAACNKCLVDSNHFARVTKMLNDVNARTKKPNIIQLILFIVDSGYTKHMTGNLKLLCNFVEKFLGLNHKLFVVGQFYDADLEVAFRKSTCFVRDLQGNDLLIGNRGSDLYIISLQESTSSTPLCLMAKALPTQAWLWHRRLSHLNFNYINLLSKKDIVIGLPKLKYVKDQLCSSCELSKAKRSSFKSKAVPSLKGRLNLLHMNLCGPMQVANINGKKYILSKGYRVYNKRTRMIVESIHICFDEIKEVSETSIANDFRPRSSTKKASVYDNFDPVPQRQDVSSLEDAHVPSQQELDLLFGLLYDEFFNADRPLEQVRGNPSRLVQTRRQLATNPEMCMYALTLSTAEPKNIKEVMADSAWIEAMQEKLHQFDRLQAKYTLEILHKHGMEKGQSIGTPMATKPKLDADLSGNPVDQTDYRSKIGSLMYLTSSRPDIVKALYADHTRCINSCKSTSGGIQFLSDKLVSWMSKKQNCTAMSLAEAEYVALSASYAPVMWMRTQLQDYGFNYNKIPLYCDSQTKYQLADMFTKALPKDRFKYLVRRIGMRCLTPAELEVLPNESA
nr:ribonuclease H-like domain-containing protein [Tanacetum cinerariifolium]